MPTLRSLASKAVLWLIVAAGIALALACYEWGPELIHRAAALAEDPRPGERKVPTPAQARGAQEAWKKRKLDDPEYRRQHGPTGPAGPGDATPALPRPGGR